MAEQTITSNIKFLPLHADISGYERFFGSYLLYGDKYALVDVGPAAVLPSLLSALTEQEIEPDEIDYIILTHIHMDHSGGVGAAVREMKNAKVVAHERARFHLKDPTRLWNASLKVLGDLALQYGAIEPVPEDRIVDAADEMDLDLGSGLQVEMHLTPGHAYHHLSIFDSANRVLIVGEAAGVCVNGALRPSTPPPFEFEETLASIDRLIALEPGTICYAHLGCYHNAVELLKQARRQLVEWREIVKSATWNGISPEEIFDVLRRHDRSLDYLFDLSPDEYEREHKMLVNSVIGLSTQDD
jgi:glyoxylase-like metal-dependent hydrolase (beta-lactamase superfamily II)